MDTSNKPKTTVDISMATIVRITAIVLLLAFAYTIRDVFVILLVSIVVATAIDPVVDKLQARRIPRALSVISLYILIFGGVLAVLALIIPSLVTQVSELAQNFPTLYQKFINEFGAIRSLSTSAGFQQNIDGFLKSLQSNIGNIGSGIFGALTGFFGGLISFIAILVLTYYMVSEESGMKRFFRAILPTQYQPFFAQVFSKIQIRLGGWMRGQLLIMLIIAVADFIGLSIIGVKYALALALFAGLLELLPMIGSTIAAIPAIFVATTQSLTKGIITLILFFFIQQVQNNFVSPRVYRGSTGLHPIVTLTVMLIGAKIAGLLGILLAIPLAIIVTTGYQETFGKRRDAELKLEQ